MQNFMQKGTCHHGLYCSKYSFNVVVDWCPKSMVELVFDSNDRTFATFHHAIRISSVHVLLKAKSIMRKPEEPFVLEVTDALCTNRNKID